MLLRTSKREADANRTISLVYGKDPSECRIHMYSLNTLNFKVQAFDQMRRELKKTKNVTYTYSSTFNSQTISVANVDEDHSSAAARKKAWLTPSGFMYPKPRTRKELLTHPKQPTQARIDELHDSWDGPLPKQVCKWTLALRQSRQKTYQFVDRNLCINNALCSIQQRPVWTFIFSS